MVRIHKLSQHVESRRYYFHQIFYQSFQNLDILMRFRTSLFI